MGKLFVIGDLHLSGGVDKPMDIFGKAWENHTERLCENWRRTVSDDDHVVVNGDISWGMSLEEAVPDLVLLDSLPGTKIIMKGNHELWWTTMAKLRTVFKEHNIKTLLPLYNNAYFFCEKRILICGTRGWMLPGDEGFCDADAKVLRRELMRFEMSLNHGRELAEKYFDLAYGLRDKVYFDPSEMPGFGKTALPLSGERRRDYKIYAFTHFPPFVFTKREQTEFTDVIEKNNVSRCYFGHVHGVLGKGDRESGPRPIYRQGGVDYYLTAADHLKMEPEQVDGLSTEG